MAAQRREKKAAAKAKKKNVCGAQKRSGGKCQKRAGWGTEHFGIGKCRIHGGTAPNHMRHAAKQMAADFLGTPLEINPLDALLWCIKIRAGEVRWLSDRMAELDKESWVESTMVGKQFHLYARERQKAMNDLTKFSQIAIGLGIAERAVKLAETYGELLANYTKGLLDDLWPYLDAEGRAKAPLFIRERLILLDGGLSGPPVPGMAGQQKELEAAKEAA